MLRLIRVFTTLRKDESGQTLVFTALALLVLTAMVILVINVGELITKRIMMQNAADAAAISCASTQALYLNQIARLNWTQREAFEAWLIGATMESIGYLTNCVGECEGGELLIWTGKAMQQAAESIRDLINTSFSLINIIAPAEALNNGIKAGKESGATNVYPLGLPLLHLDDTIKGEGDWFKFRYITCVCVPILGCGCVPDIFNIGMREKEWTKFVTKKNNEIGSSESLTWVATKQGGPAWASGLISGSKGKVEFPTITTIAKARVYVGGKYSKNLTQKTGFEFPSTIDPYSNKEYYMLTKPRNINNEEDRKKFDIWGSALIKSEFTMH